MCPHMQIGCSASLQPCVDLSATQFTTLLAWQTHGERMHPSGPVASAARVAASVFRSTGDMGTRSPQSCCKSQKLVKNCSNFLLVKQTSQTNRPQLFVAACNRNAAKTNISVSVSVSRLSSLHALGMPARPESLLDKTHFDHCQGFWPSSRGGVNILWIYAGSAASEGKTRPREKSLLWHFLLYGQHSVWACVVCFGPNLHIISRINSQTRFLYGDF